MSTKLRLSFIVVLSILSLSACSIKQKIDPIEVTSSTEVCIVENKDVREGFLKEFEKVGELITKVVKGLSENPDDNSKIEEEVRNEVITLTSSFPIYKNLK